MADSSTSLISNIFIANVAYRVERINNLVTQKTLSRPSIVTGDNNATVLDEDISGYSSFSIIFANPGSNGVVFTVQGNHTSRPGFYGDIGTAITVTAGGTSSIAFVGEYDRLRVLAKNQTGGQNSKAWASLKGRIGG